MDQPRNSARTLTDVAELWLEHNPSKRVNTLATDSVDVRVHILPALGTRAIGDVSPALVQRVVNEWVNGTGRRKAGARKVAAAPAPRTVRRRYLTLQAIFNYAVDNDWIARSPCRKIKLPSVTSSTPRRSYPLSDEQVGEIANAIPEQYRPMVWIGAIAGLRWEEVAALRGNDVDLEANTLQIDETVIRNHQGAPSFAEPKSAASGATVPIPPALASMLPVPSDPEALLFPAPSGGPLRPDNFRSRVWYPALRTCGLFDARPYRPGFHDLRRSFATGLVAGRVDVRTAQSLMRHADSRLTLEVYAKEVDETARRASDLVATRLFSTNRKERSGTTNARKMPKRPRGTRAQG